jgi:hypothetical protein
MIGISKKEGEEAATQGAQQRRRALRLKFWAKKLERLRADRIILFANVSPMGDHCLDAGSGVGACPFSMVFSHKEARVELSLQRSEVAENKRLFDQIFSCREKIEADFGHTLDWRRMDDKKSSRVVYAREFDGDDEESWPEMIAWLSDHMKDLVASVQGPLKHAGQSNHLVDEEKD